MLPRFVRFAIMIYAIAGTYRCGARKRPVREHCVKRTASHTFSAALVLPCKMQLLQRKKSEPSFVISIESGVEEVREAKVHEECDFLVDVLTGKRSVSPDFCCKMLYMIFCTCFTSEPSQRRVPASVVAPQPSTSITAQRPLTYQTI